MNTVHGMIAFLRGEADLAEARAKQLRLTAALIQANQHERRPSSSIQPPKKRKKRDDAVNRSVETSAAASRGVGPAVSASAADEEGQPTRHDAYDLGHELFLRTHLSEPDKQQHARESENIIQRRRGGDDDDKEGPDDDDGVMAALERKWVATDDIEKKAWQKRAEEMNLAASASVAAAETRANRSESGQPVAKAADPVTGLDSDEDDDDDEDDNDDDKLEPLDDAEGEDEWGDRKRPATKKHTASV